MNERLGMILYSTLSAVMEYYQKVPSGLEKAHTRYFQGLDDESMTMQRLGRAFSNVCDSETRATYSRFAIWGADMNAIIQKAIDALNASDTKCALDQLAVVQKNLRAFIDCCSLIDSQPGWMQFETTDEILTEIKQRMEEAGESTMPQFENTYKSICEALKRLDGGTVE
jgi:hypothetical protein